MSGAWVSGWCGVSGLTGSTVSGRLTPLRSENYVPETTEQTNDMPTHYSARRCSLPASISSFAALRSASDSRFFST